MNGSVARRSLERGPALRRPPYGGALAPEIVPPPPGVDLDAELRALRGAPTLPPHLCLSSSPVLVSHRWAGQLRALSGALDAALSAIVRRYFEDPRIRAIYALPAALERVLERARDAPYRIGFYRPDFVFDRQGQARICEIGARFPLNGWMLSHWAAEVCSHSSQYDAFRPQPEHGSFWPLLFDLHPPGCSVAMVHRLEAGTEIFHLGDRLRDRGVRFQSCAPDQLRVRDGRLAAGDRIVDRCILEMDRSELPAIRHEVLDHMIERENYFNDVRTLILVHDKRALAVLCNTELMRDHLDATQLAILKPFLIPSWTVGDARAAEALLRREDDMIAKRSSGGRGIDAVVRRDCGEAAWRRLVLDHHDGFMFQAYVDQMPFLDPEDGRSIHLVGMQLCHGPVSHGVGAFRGSDESIINVHQGRGRLFPTLMRA